MNIQKCLPITLVSLLSCSKYPANANLSVYADSIRYTICGDRGDGEYSELGAVNTPSWLEDIGPEINLEISLERSGSSRILYDGFYMDKNGKKVAPYIPHILDQARVISADCGVHHPDSHDSCGASVKVSEPVILTYRISSFPGEKNIEDNMTRVSLNIEDLQGHAGYLSATWYEQEQKEAEAERKEIAEKNKGIK